MLGKRVRCKDCGADFDVATAPPRPLQPPPARAFEPMPAPDPAASEPLEAGIPDPPAVTAPYPPVAKAQKPFGLVWIVFNWAMAGVSLVVIGGIFLALGTALGAANEASRTMFGPLGLRDAGGDAALRSILLEILGLLVFHYGLLLLVTCYGLWTFRRWGLSWAKSLAVGNAILVLIGLVISVVTRVGIVASVVGVFISAGILAYLYGSVDLRDRLHRVIPAGGLRAGAWNQ